eukprot:2533362-Rhodomonas_salina.2
MSSALAPVAMMLDLTGAREGIGLPGTNCSPIIDAQCFLNAGLGMLLVRESATWSADTTFSSTITPSLHS